MKTGISFDTPGQNPLHQEQFRGLKQGGMSEEAATRKVAGLNVLPSKAKMPKAVAAPKGLKLKAMEIRPGASGVIVKHTYDRMPGHGAGNFNGTPQPDDLPSLEPQEHAFGSTADALEHVNQHLGDLMGRNDLQG